MSANIESLKSEVEALQKSLQKEIHRREFLEKKLRVLSGGIPREIPIPKKELNRLVKDNKPTKDIAKKYGVSERTIYRKIKKYDLKGLRPKGRKTSIIKEIVKGGKWVSVQSYMDKLNRKYHFVNIQYPRSRFINERTLVCSDQRSNPEGVYTTVGIYYIVRQSDANFVYRTSIKYNVAPAYFDEISLWARRNAYDMVSNLWIDNAVEVEKVIALTFINPASKPEKVSNKGVEK